jgi:molybdopterin-guanine dinucleotide biosynthesis protein B
MGLSFPTVIDICSAHRKQGKTKLITRVLEGLTKEGFIVGSIKHIGAESAFDGPPKDTSRHAEAGARIVVAVTGSEVITINKDQDPSLKAAIKKFPKDYDFIIVEGFKRSHLPRFILIDSADELGELYKAGKVLGITGYIAQKKQELDKLDKIYPIIDEKDTETFLKIIKNERHLQILSILPKRNCGECGLKDCMEMAQLLLEKKVSFNKCPHMTAKLTLEVDDDLIPVKDFVQNFLRGSIEGMLQTLKGVPKNPKKMSILIEYDTE